MSNVFTLDIATFIKYNVYFINLYTFQYRLAFL